MNRSTRANLAKQTVEIIRNGSYVSATGRPISIRPQIDDCVAATRIVKPDEWNRIVEHTSAMINPGPAVIEVTGETTLAAVRRLSDESHRGRVGALNFASAKNRGGGFLSGSQAQEESLARSSGLYASQTAAPGYYTANRAADVRYTDHAILSPRTPVFRDDDGTLLDDPYPVTFITMPAANYGAMPGGSPLKGEVETLMARRCSYVLALAVSSGCRAIVLGAWGCGVFRNDPVVIAKAFAHSMSADQPWRRSFDRIVFAVYDTSPSRSIHAAFEGQFGVQNAGV